MGSGRPAPGLHRPALHARAGDGDVARSAGAARRRVREAAPRAARPHQRPGGHRRRGAEPLRRRVLRGGAARGLRALRRRLPGVALGRPGGRPRGRPRRSRTADEGRDRLAALRSRPKLDGRVVRHPERAPALRPPPSVERRSTCPGVLPGRLHRRRRGADLHLRRGGLARAGHLRRRGGRSRQERVGSRCAHGGDPRPLRDLDGARARATAPVDDEAAHVRGPAVPRELPVRAS